MLSPVDPFEGYQYVNRFGVICTTHGASTIGVIRFGKLLEQIRHTLMNCQEDDLTWQFYYLSDRDFQAAIQECLTLNNIDPDTVTLAMVNALLFDPGHLVHINTPPERVARNSEPATLGEIIGAIATQTQSLEEAIRLAETVPAQQLRAVMLGKNKLESLKTEEGKKRETAKTLKAKAKQQLEEMRQKAVANG